MHTQMNVARYSIKRDYDEFNIYTFIEENEYNFYIERKGYNNLYYICNVPDKNKIDNVVEFIHENTESWIFFVMNETEED